MKLAFPASCLSAQGTALQCWLDLAQPRSVGLQDALGQGLSVCPSDSPAPWGKGLVRVLSARSFRDRERRSGPGRGRVGWPSQV